MFTNWKKKKNKNAGATNMAAADSTCEGSAIASAQSPDDKVQNPQKQQTGADQSTTEIPKDPDGFEVAQATTDFIELKWKQVTSNQLYGYRLERSFAFKNEWSRAHDKPVLPARTVRFKVVKVKPYAAYDVCVKSATLDSSSGELHYSDGSKLQNIVAKKKGQPFPPRDVKVKEVKEESVSLTWQEPEPDDDENDENPVTYEYVIEMCPYSDGKILNQWKECGVRTTELQCQVKVQHDGNYRFRVSAHNKDRNISSLPKEMGDPDQPICIKQRTADVGWLERLKRIWNFWGTTPERQEDGSIIFVISCHDMDGLRELWMNYNLGKLHKFFQDLFAQEDSPASDLDDTELDIEIDEKNFYACRQHLLLTCPNSKGFRVVKVGDTSPRACPQSGLSEDFPVYCKPVLQRTAFSELDFLDLEITTKQPTGTKPSSTTTMDISPGIKRKYEEHLRKGDDALMKSNLDGAENHFAAALKLVHITDPNVQQYQREVEPLCKLGDVYSKRGQQTEDGGDFVKAAALYNAAIARSSDCGLNDGIDKAITCTEGLFIEHVLGLDHIVQKAEKEKHKEHLKEMRDQIKLEMETIDQQLDPYVHDENDPCVKEIEAKRAQAVRQLFERIAAERKQFVTQLVEECIGLMGPPPCKYALIGLGSQATELVTPYSDLEFAILVEKADEHQLVYFRNLTNYLHLKVVNLGETVLQALEIQCLNDIYSGNPLDSWYCDSITPHGLAFDISLAKASKTLLGRQGEANQPSGILICTLDSMVSLLQNVTSNLKGGYRLANILRNPCLILGDQDLFDTYNMAIKAEILHADKGRIAQQLALKTLSENITSYDDEETRSSKIIDVKEKVKCFPTVAVDFVALCFSITPTTVWKTIDIMEVKGIVSDENAYHLRLMVSISAELRLRTHIANGGQTEILSALASMKSNVDEETSALKQVFNLNNEKQLFRYYQTAIPLRTSLSKWSDKDANPQLFPDFRIHDNSHTLQGVMYSDLCEYKMAIRSFEEALKKPESDKINLLSNLGDAWNRLGDHQEAISYLEQALDMKREIYGQNAEHPEIAFSIQSLGVAYIQINDSKAVSYLKQALQMYRSLYGEGQETDHPDIAKTLNYLGLAWYRLSDPYKAISYHEEALQMYRRMYGPDTVYPDIAKTLNDLGLLCNHLGKQRDLGINYHEQALQMYIRIYGNSKANPDIAKTLNYLGIALNHQRNHRKAISYHEQALQMYRSIYGRNAENLDIAKTLNYLGTVWNHLGEQRELAISYHNQALQMYRNINGENAVTPDIAKTLNYLGLAWNYHGDRKKAIDCHKEALRMYDDISHQSTVHLNAKAKTHNYLGSAWIQLGEYRTGISHHEEALQMFRIFYSKAKTHSEIAKTLNYLGSAWNQLKEYDKAIAYNEEALQMYRRIQYQGKVHTDIATLLNSLGQAYSSQCDHERAVGCYEEALQMYRRLQYKGKFRTDIATLLDNLGQAYRSQGDDMRAAGHYREALQMYRSIHGKLTVHMDIAKTLYNLGSVWNQLGKHKEAIDYNEEALQMYWKIHGKDTKHIDIATILNNLGQAYSNQGDNRTAINYYKQALKMYRSIHGHDTVPDIAKTFNHLGSSWGYVKEPKKAIRDHEKALQIYKGIYKQGTVHPDIARTLNHLGSAWYQIGDYMQAIKYHEEALHMYRTIYGEGTDHTDAAKTLNYLGSAWSCMKEHRKAISYHVEALQMYQNIYGQSTAHSNIAKSLKNLALSYHFSGDHRKAHSICQEALDMAKWIYNPNHPLIKQIERNLNMINYNS